MFPDRVRRHEVSRGHRGRAGAGGGVRDQPSDLDPASGETPLVGVLVGSASDLPVMQQTTAILQRFGIPFEMRVISAHRSPDLVDEFARTAEERGMVCLICGAGMANHLAGAVAARTALPVIGVPLSGSKLSGMDALYSTVQMPKGVPVATVAIDGAINAAILAAQIIAVRDPEVRAKIYEFKDSLAEGFKP
ncbi:MAG: 5-(carboxyamino)imidazole ribonucleotide mutase [Actinobacteria bacterium]|nr:MAG: 5-(carboxyamino)imidazole ribonucleotide mutase [Actinomycetota bacterium]